MCRVLVSPSWVSPVLKTQCTNLGFLHSKAFVQPLTTLCLSQASRAQSQGANSRSQEIHSLWKGSTASSNNLVRSLWTGVPKGSVQPLTTLCLSQSSRTQAHHDADRPRGMQSLWNNNTANAHSLVHSLSTVAPKGNGRRQAKASWAQTRAAPVDEGPTDSPSKLKTWFQNPLGDPPSPEMQEKKKKTGIMYMLKTYGLTFFLYSTSVYAVGLVGIFISLEAYGQTDELLVAAQGVLESYNWDSTANLLDDLDPQYGNAAVAIVLNEFLQLPLVPVVIATTPAVAKFFRKTK